MLEIDVDKITALRKHYQITQEGAAKALGIGRVTYVMRERHGTFNDDELNFLSELLKVNRSELIKKETSAAETGQAELQKFAKKVVKERDVFIHRQLSRKFEELTTDVKRSIKAQTKTLNEPESVYQSKYVSLLEDQLRAKDETVKALREQLDRVETDTELMFAKLHMQLMEFYEKIKSNFDESRAFSIKAIENLSEQTKKQQEEVSKKLTEFDILLKGENNLIVIELKGISPKLSPELIKKKVKSYLQGSLKQSSKTIVKKSID